MIVRLLLLNLSSVLVVFLLAGWSALGRAERDRLTDAPRLTWPASGETVAATQPLLRWRNPGDATYYELQVRPVSRPGSSIHMYGALIAQYQTPGPPQWCCIEPDTEYAWRVRVSFEEDPVTPDDPLWGPWAEGTFRVAPPRYGTQLGGPDLP